MRWALLVSLALVVGCSSNEPAEGPLAAQDEEAVAIEAEPPSGPFHDSYRQAAIVAAIEDNPNLDEPVVGRAVALFSDPTTIELRVQLVADEYCRWIPVVGTARQESIAWQAGSPVVCADE